MNEWVQVVGSDKYSKNQLNGKIISTGTKSLIFGIFAMIKFGWIFGPIAIVCGRKNTNEDQRTIAAIGFALGIVALVEFAFNILMALLIFGRIDYFIFLYR